MRLLHTADLHLDSAFCSYGVKDAEKQREEGRKLLQRIFDAARSKDCQMILIAGDLFDSRFVSHETAELFCALVESCSIPVVVSPGNHDPYTESSFYAKAARRLGDKLSLFTSPELQIFDFDELGVRVYGYAFTSGFIGNSPLSDVEMPTDNGYLKIFCGHADLDNPVSRYAPVKLGELEGFDYAALGHVHNVKEYEDEEGRVRYSGFAQGRAFDELGEGGVWIVDLDGEKCVCQREILSLRAFFEKSVDLTAEDSESEMEEKIWAVAQGFGERGAYVRVILNGIADESEMAALKRRVPQISSELGLEYLEFDDRTLPFLDGEYLERDTTLRGELYRVLRPKLMSDDAEERAVALKALRIGLAAIDGKNIFGVAE